MISMQHFYNRIQHDYIPNSFDYPELYARAVEDFNGEVGKFVEVGCYVGRSSAFMATEIIRSGKNIEFYCVDKWDMHRASLMIFKQNMNPVLGKINIIEKPSIVAAKDFEDESLDFVFIDAAHDFQDVVEDIRAWLPKVKKGGILAGHDYDFAGVKAAVEEELPVSLVETCFRCWKFKKGSHLAGKWIHRLPLKDKLTKHLVCIPIVTNPTRLDLTFSETFNDDVNYLIVDSSKDGLNLEKYSWFNKVSVYKTDGQPNFVQIQNFFQYIATEEKINMLGFMHTDVRFRDAKVIPDLLKYSTIVFDQPGNKTAVVLTQYDSLCFFNMRLLKYIGVWDETFYWYHADDDYYERFELHGFNRIIWREKARVEHVISASMTDDPKMKEIGMESFDWGQKHREHKWKNYVQTKVPYGLHYRKNT